MRPFAMTRSTSLMRSRSFRACSVGLIAVGAQQTQQLRGGRWKVADVLGEIDAVGARGPGLAERAALLVGEVAPQRGVDQQLRVRKFPMEARRVVGRALGGGDDLNT